MALHGSIDSFPIVDVLRLLGGTAKTGCLTLDGDRGSGSLWFIDGAIVGAQASSVPDGRIEAVVFDLLRFAEGEFDFDAHSTAPEQVEPESVDDVLDAAVAMLDEMAEVLAVVSGSDAWLTLTSEIDADEVTLSSAQWSAIVAIGGGTEVGQLGSALRLDELSALRLAFELITSGVVGQRERSAEQPVEHHVDQPVEHRVVVVEPEAVTDHEPVAELEPVSEENAHPDFAPSAIFVMEAPHAEVAEPPVDAVAHDDSVQDDAANGSSIDELFGEFDPFGGSDAPDVVTPVADHSGLPEQPVADPSQNEFVPVDTAADDAAAVESIRAQMAMMSPAAAQAIAAARRTSTLTPEQGGETEAPSQAPAAPFAPPPPAPPTTESSDDPGRSAVSNYLNKL